MGNRKLLVILVIVSGLVLAGVILYFIFFSNRNSAPETGSEPAGQFSGENLPASNTGAAKTEGTAEEGGEAFIIDDKSLTKPLAKEVMPADLERMAASFAERFGSFSNQSNYGNIRDLEIFMSASMKAWAEDYIASAIASNAQSALYYGITTKAVSEETKSFSQEDGRAEIIVKAQRREASGLSSNFSTFYQDIVITFTKERGAWKVASAYWQKR